MTPRLCVARSAHRTGYRHHSFGLVFVGQGQDPRPTRSALCLCTDRCGVRLDGRFVFDGWPATGVSDVPAAASPGGDPGVLAHDVCHRAGGAPPHHPCDWAVHLRLDWLCRDGYARRLPRHERKPALPAETVGVQQITDCRVAFADGWPWIGFDVMGWGVTLIEKHTPFTLGKPPLLPPLPRARLPFKLPFKGAEGGFL